MSGIVKKDIALLFPELSYRLNGIFFRIHKNLGRYCREKQYADEMEKEFQKEKINYQREYRVIKDDEFAGNVTDFLVENNVVVELKAKRYINKEDFYQTQRYLKSSNKMLGLLVNFQDDFIKTKRVLNNY